MSDQPTSGEQVPAPATPAGAAPVAVTPGDDRPIGAFGTARGSGLARGKRATPPAATATAPAGSYKPTAIEVIKPQREYTNPFASEAPAAAPANEPAPQAAPTSLEVNGPVTSASEPPAVTAPAAGEPVGAPPEVIQPSVEKAEIKILPPAEAKRPAVSWGEATHETDTRPQPEPRASFQPERRERKFEPREPRPFEPREPREPRSFEPREAREPHSFEPREPREPRPFEPRGQPRDSSEARGQRNDRPAERAQPAPKKSGGFFAWLKGLFGGKSGTGAPTPVEDRNFRDNREGGDFQRRRHRGGRGRGGYQGDNRGPRDGQPRDQYQGGGNQGGSGYQGSDQPQGERNFEGGGRRRRRGGRGRYRDDRGGPRPEGQQGGGAI